MSGEAPDLSAESIGNPAPDEVAAELLRNDLSLEHHDHLSLRVVPDHANLGCGRVRG